VLHTRPITRGCAAWRFIYIILFALAAGAHVGGKQPRRRSRKVIRLVGIMYPCILEIGNPASTCLSIRRWIYMQAGVHVTGKEMPDGRRNNLSI
jgi:hypothetical protein